MPGLITRYAKIRKSYVSTSNNLKKESSLDRLPSARDVEGLQDKPQSRMELELLRSIGEKDSIIQELTLVKIKNLNEIQKLQAGLNKSHEDKKEVMQQHEERMNVFLDEMERTVDSYKSKMDIRVSTIKTLQDELACLKKKGIENKDEYNNERAQHIKDGCLLRREIKLLEDKEEMEFCSQKQFDLAQQATEEMHRAIIKDSKDALVALGVQHEQELGQVKQSVKDVIEFKDRKLKDAVQRAKEANERAQAFEVCIAKIENGFEDSKVSAIITEEKSRALLL
eukprot:scaffold2062_cov273-Chaetoceros_neogracile.AAC.48